MNNRYMESPNNMAPRAEKRSSDASSSEEGQPQRKRPALASVIIEALKVNSLQKLCSSLEPILRKVVSEEVERALAKLGPANNAKLSGRVSPKRIEGPDGRKLQLHFRSKLSLPLFTGGKVEGEYGAPIHIVLLDANTGHVVTHGPESSARLDVVVLEGDFNGEEEEDGQGWTEEEFESHIVKEREGKRPLLTGDLQVVLKQGVGTLGELTFTDNSSWIRSRKFRLGLRVAASSSGFEGFRIREAKTNAFMVKDHRGELYKKHYPPTLNDEVWRLEKIGKDGSFHKRLNVAGIHTVEDFLRLVVRDQQKLRSILGTGMSNKMWEALIEHSKTCVLSEKLYIYYPDEPRNVGVVFNNIYELIGLIVGGMYQSLDSLSDNQKVYVDALVKKAYDNWAHVIEYDGKSLMGFNQSNNMSDSSQTDHNRVRSHHQPSSFDHHSLPSLPPSVSPENPLNLGGYRDNIGGGGKYTMQSQSTNANVPHQYSNASSSFAPQQPVVSNSNNVLALGPPASTSSEFSIASASSLASSYRENRSVPEDEIRLRSHEMLEADDMQQLLRMYSMGGHHGIDSFNAHENNYGFSAFTPFTPSNFVFEEDRTRSSGKAVVGWLKLKAALRWGIFVRKKAAEKRAQITELDDESLT